MQYSYLGFSTLKMKELKLDVKDMIILRYFIDFKDTGKMIFEIVNGKKYYWINYKTMEEGMPHLDLGKKAIMKRMYKLRDMGILDHYTKKEGGTFSYFAVGAKYYELINYSQGNPKKEEGVSQNIDKGSLLKYPAKINLLNNSSTKEININIKRAVDEIIEYLNSKINAKYNPNSYNNIKLINLRLKEGYTIDDFKTVIDKKVSGWLGTEFEQYLTPQTLFGSKFEKYLNQKIITKSKRVKNSYDDIPKLRFDNFRPREYDYAALERKLLGWE